MHPDHALRLLPRLGQGGRPLPAIELVHYLMGLKELGWVSAWTNERVWVRRVVAGHC
jgi:hypothetical protein